ncbi:MAG TPA: glycosyltransferase family 4 protein [Gaiellaceae bacterium]|nr:glycosyltransferase family 4 protein [Gaiellaceae bacterium]
MSGRIRVVRVIARLNMGGPALHVAYLTKGLEQRGYDTTLVAGSLARGESSMSFVAEELGVEVYPLPQLSREISPVYDTLSVLRLVGLIKRTRPQILHTHTAKAGAVGRLAAALAGDARPPIVVHTFHGHVLRGYFNPVLSYLFRELERVLAAGTTRLVAVGPQVRDDLVALGVAPGEKFTVIRLGIDLDDRISGEQERRHELRRLFGVPPETFVVGWIGRMTAIKRVPDVLQAFRRLLDRGLAARLCLVGDGPDRVRVERIAHDLGISRSTLFIGYQRDVAPYYAFFDALLLPSANEGTPVVAIEALASARPVVATRVGGVPDVVTDGVDGYLVAVGDVGAMANRLAELAADPGLRRRLGAAGRERVVERYRVERLIDDVDALYRELLREAGLPQPPVEVRPRPAPGRVL